MIRIIWTLLVLIGFVLLIFVPEYKISWIALIVINLILLLGSFIKIQRKKE